LPLEAKAEGRACYSGQEGKIGNLNYVLQGSDRFKDCKKGDVITVFVVPSSVSDMEEYGAWKDEVSDYCSFSHQIALVDEVDNARIEGKKWHRPIKVFNCVYVGEKRDAAFSELKTKSIKE